MERALSADVRPEALERTVRALHTVQLNHPVGQAYEYSNAGYMVLGLLVQQISGQPYEEYMREHLYQPLAMRQTYTDWSAARAHGAASGYRYWFGVPVAGNLPVNRANLPAGAHTSASAEDVAHFLIAQVNGGRLGSTSILSPGGIAAMRRPDRPGANRQQPRAIGWDFVGPIEGVTALIKSGDSASAGLIVKAANVVIHMISTYLLSIV
jgi:CubicO group peptidase (beta-lactamase class C family)